MADLSEVGEPSTPRGWHKRGTKVLAWCLLIGAVVASYAVFSVLWPPVFHRLSGEHGVTEATAAKAPVNPYAAAHGRHLVAYFFTASDCGWSRVLENHKVIRSLRSDLRSVHGADYVQVTVVGVGLDRDLEKGLSFLSQVGNGSVATAFDQVVVGGSWFNDQMVRFAWQSKRIRPALPQILVVERDVSTAAYISTHAIGVGTDLIVANLTGQHAIREWVKGSYPIDRAGQGGPAVASQ